MKTDKIIDYIQKISEIEKTLINERDTRKKNI